MTKPPAVTDLRPRLWPIWSVALGLGYPLAFLYAVDGLAKHQQWPQLLLTFSSGWAFHASLTLLLCCGPWLLLRVAARFAPARVRDAAQAGIVVAARFFLGCLIALTAYLWLREVAPGAAARFNQGRGWIVLAVLILSAVTGVRQPAAGAFLQGARRIAIAGGALTVVLLPGEALFNWVASKPAPRADSRPTSTQLQDVVLITIDALSAKHLSLYGYPRPTTPRLDQFAQRAVVFDRYYANSNFTTATVASFLLSTRPWTHRALQLGARPLDAPSRASLLGQFHDAGYRVMAVDTNPYASPRMMGLSASVDRSASFRMRTFYFSTGFIGRWLPSFEYITTFRTVTAAIFLGERLLMQARPPFANDHYDPSLALADARRMWSEDTGQPRFLWVHLMPPHSPYASPAPYLGMFDAAASHRTRLNSAPPLQFNAAQVPDFPQAYVGRYDEAVRFVDDHVGEFLDWLQAQPGWDRTAVVVSADHGESFSRGYGDHCGPLLTEELIRIPLIIRRPGAADASRVAILAEEIDLAPTLARLGGLAVPDGWEGRALVGDEAPAPKQAVFVMNFERNRRFDELSTGSLAMIEEDWKYVHYHHVQAYPHMPVLSDELYALGSDPAEGVNVIGQHPEIAQRMKAAILRELQQHGQPVS